MKFFELMWIALPLAAAAVLLWMIFSRRRALRRTQRFEADFLSFQKQCTDALNERGHGRLSAMKMISPDAFEIRFEKADGEATIAHCVHRPYDRPLEYPFLENLDRVVSKSDADLGILVTNRMFSPQILRARPLNDIRLMNGELLDQSIKPSERSLQ